MSYDYGRKFISKMTGLTGVESGLVAKQLKEMNVDYGIIDWETVGGDLYGHGSRLGGIKHHLKTGYGIDIDPYAGMDKYFDMSELRIKPGRRKHRMTVTDRGASLWSLRMFYSKRTPRQRAIDNRIKAKKRFRHTNRAGIELWLKNPNRYDILGVDWKPKRRKRNG